MFGCKNKCLCYECCRPPVDNNMSTAMIHIQYAQKIVQLESELYDAKRTIQELAETNKHLSKVLNRKTE